jgi:hypothetical protein
MAADHARLEGLTARVSCESPHGHPDKWRKSSYSVAEDGNSCVEIANRRTLVVTSMPTA